MLKRTLLTMTALSSLILISPTLQDTAIAGQYNKPKIGMFKPQFKVKIDTRRLVTKAAKKPAGNGVAHAGPQPEPPTRPKQIQVTYVANPVPAPLPRSRPYNEFEEKGLGGDIDVAGALPPELNAPDAIKELFDISGGNPNDLMAVAEELLAMRDLFEEVGSNPLEDPALGRPRFGASMDGPPVAPGPHPNNGGVDSSPGWTLGGVYHKATNDSYGAHWSRQTSHGTDTRDISYGGPNGEITETIVIHGPNGQTTTTTTESHLTKDDARRSTTTVETENGMVVKEEETPAPAEEEETEGGEGGEGGEEGDGDTEAGQGAPDDTITGGTGGCGVWTPFGGCTGTGSKIWETTGQPDPSDDGTTTTRSAGDSIGPEAVTNADEFHTGSGGGGVHIDPCIAAGGDCGNGPGNPTASMGDRQAAGS